MLSSFIILTIFLFPHLWKILKEWDSRARRKFRADYSVEELEEKFKKR